MINGSLLIIERMIESVYLELKIASQDPTVDSKAHILLREALVEAVNLKRKVETARAWNLSLSNSNA